MQELDLNFNFEFKQHNNVQSTIKVENYSKISEFALNYEDGRPKESNMNFDDYNFNELKINNDMAFTNFPQNANNLEKTQKNPFVILFIFLQ